MSILVFAFDLLHVGRVWIAARHGRTSIAVLFALRRRDRIPLKQKKMGKRKKIEMCYCVPSAAAKYVTRPLTGRQHEREEKTNWQLRTLATVTMATREKVISSFASHDKRHWAPRGRKIHFHSLSLFRVSFSSIFRISPSSKGRYYTQKHP